MNTTEQNADARVRRLAKAAGYVLRKSRQPEGADNLGGFMIVDLGINGCLAGSRFDLDAADVEAWLKDAE